MPDPNTKPKDLKALSQPDMVEGIEAYTRFENAMKKVLSVPHADIKRRIEEHRKEAALNPNKRGPKAKTEKRRRTVRG